MEKGQTSKELSNLMAAIVHRVVYIIDYINFASFTNDDSKLR
jgi:uncharacterized protein (UPF0333 family)